MESILTSIKKLLGMGEDYTHFDDDIIMHINMVFSTLNQLGVGPPNGFIIKDNEAVWGDFVNDEKKFEAVKTYIYLKVKTVFDPPQSSAVLESIKENIAELEWRLSDSAEEKKYKEENQNE